MIEGTLPSVKYDGEWIYLVPMENAPGRVDSVKITNASFLFRTRGGDEGVASAPSAAYLHPGTAGGDGAGNHTCEGRLCRFGNGHSANDALQKWKEGREKKQEAYHLSGRDYGMPPERFTASDTDT